MLPPWREKFLKSEDIGPEIEPPKRAPAPAPKKEHRMGIAIGFDYSAPDYVLERTKEALYARATRTEPPEAAREFMGGHSFARLCYSALRVAGYAGSLDITRRVDRVEAIRLSMIHASDLPNILANLNSKHLLNTYHAMSPAYRAIASRRDFADFRDHLVTRLGDFSRPQRVGPGGEILSAALTEANAEWARLHNYASVATLSYEAMLADDVGALGDIARAAARGALDTESEVFFSVLTSGTSSNGPTMSDGAQFFATSHGNLAGSGAAISTTTVGAARAAVMAQTSPGGSKSIAVPTLLVCPPALATLAEETLAKLAPGADPATRMRVVPAAHLSGTAWYLFTAPTQLESMIYARLGGSGDGPMMLGQRAWRVDGIEFKVEMTFGAAAIDWRGAYKNPGA